MTSDRPYRGAFSQAAAIDEVARKSGHQFCPTSAGALLEVLRTETEEWEEPAQAPSAGSRTG